MRSPLPTRTRRDRGAVIPIVALALTMLMTMTAFAVDLGRMRTERRDLQAAADAIAMDAVQMIAGLDAAAAQPVAVTEANASAIRNGLDVVLTDNEVQVGSWDVPTQSFTQMTTALEFPTAVRVILTDTVEMFFDFTTDERSVTRRAVAVSIGQARAELGSVFAGLQTYDPANLSQCDAGQDAQMTFMNHIYSDLLGITVDGGGSAEVDTGPIDCGVTGADDGLALDLASWRGLAFGQVDLVDVANEMGFASADDLLSSNVSAAELLSASATSMQNSGNATDVAAGTILGSFTSYIAQDLDVALFDLFDGKVGSPSAGAADFTVNVLGLLSATAMAIDGNNFLSTEIPISLPGAKSTITPRISIVEPPRLDAFKFVGQDGPHTAQVRLALEIPLEVLDLDFSILGGVLAALGTRQSTGTISLVVEAARADSVYDRIACSPDGPDAASVDFTVDTGAVTIGLGSVSDTVLQGDDDIDWEADLDPLPLINGSFGVSILGLGLISIDLSAVTNVSSSVNLLGATETHTFDGPFRTDFYRYDGGLGGTALTDQLFAGVDYNITGGLLSSLGTTTVLIEQLISNALAPVLADLQPEVLDPLLTSLGITVGGADARMDKVRCQVPALANRD